jgi:hypothetical protein
VGANFSLVDAVAKGDMTGRVVALHPAAIAIYLHMVEQLTNALSASDAKAASLKLPELIDCIVVAPRVKPSDPIHFEFADI